MARVVVPSIPHHIIQRGNRRQETFFCEADYEAYMELLAEWCKRCGVQVWAYFLCTSTTECRKVAALIANGAAFMPHLRQALSLLSHI